MNWYTKRRKGNSEQVKFQVLTVASVKMTTLWNIVLYSLAEIYRRFRGTYRLHNLGDHLGDGKSTHL
jgi:hypothetical protein